MPRQPVPTRVVNSGPFLLLTATAGTVIPFLAFVLSPSFRAWVEGHGMWVFWISFGAIAFLVLCMELQRHEVNPDQRDVDLWARFRADLGADGDLMTWLKGWFEPDRFSQPKWHELEEVYRAWSDDPSRRFHDRKVQRTYETSLERLGEFISRTNQDTWPRDREGDSGTMGLPREWKDDGEMSKRYYTAADEIFEARSEFVKAHSALLKRADKRGL